MSESERLDYIKDQSSLKYQPSKYVPYWSIFTKHFCDSDFSYQKKPSAIMSGPPPPTYICNRCSQPGHWFKNCPLVTASFRHVLRLLSVTNNAINKSTHF